MPNHTDNLLTIVGEKRIKEILKPYINPNNKNKRHKSWGDEYFLDFEKIVPMPKLITETSKLASCDYLEKTLQNAKTRAKHEKKLKKLEAECLEKYGVKGWYEWSNQYWGTKWNSYSNNFYITEDKEENEGLFFQTAWSPPAPVLVELSKKLNKILRVAYKDEGYGFFGVYHFYPDGKVDDECYTEHHLVPEELCRELGINTYEEDLKEREEELRMEKELEKE